MNFKLMALCSASLIASIASADVTYSDGTFQNSNWGFETVTIGGVTSFGSASQSAATGNPGSARRVNHSTAVGESFFTFNRFGTTVATRYEPGVQGAILSLDWSIDARWVSGSFGGQGQAIMLGAKQGQTVFYADYDITGSNGAWVTNNATGLTGASFLPLTGVGTLNFSAGGAPIRFGFITGNGATGTSYTNVADYDNFNLVVRTVPSVGVLPVMAAAGLMAGRRRRLGV